MREVHLLGEEWEGARLQRVGDTVLVSVEDERGDGPFADGRRAAAFDLAGLLPLGPANCFGSPVRLACLPSFGPVPVLGFITGESLVVADVRDGSVLETFPLPGAGAGRRRNNLCDLALGHYRGRDLLFLHEENGVGPYHRSVSVTDLATGEPFPALGCDHRRYKEISECLTLRHGYLAWPTTEEVVEFWPEDFSVVDKPFVYVQRAEDGSWVGKVGLEDWVPADREVEISHAAGRAYLADAGHIVILPGLEPVFPKWDPWAVVSRVTEWDGRPVAVLVRERAYPQQLPGHVYLVFLDTDAREEVAVPWSVPPQVHDLLATPDGTIVVSSAAGVHVLHLDPVEAARTGPPVRDGRCQGGSGPT